MMLPVAAMLAATVGFAMASTLSKLLLAHLATTQVNMLRFGVAALVLWGVVVATGQLSRIGRVGIKPFILGLIDPGTVSLIFVTGLSLTKASHGLVLFALAPVLMPLLAFLVLREPIRRSTYGSAVLAVAGTLVLFLGADSGSGGSLTGDLICLGSVILTSMSVLLARRVASGTGGNALPTTAVQLTMAAMLPLLVELALPRTVPAIADVPPHVWAIGVTMGIVGGALPFLLFNYALTTMPVGRASMFPPLVAPIGVVLATILLGETLGIAVMVAIALLLSAVFLPNILTLVRRVP
jgi:drug/metabolite transporter (DMT)-like permease